MPNKSAPTIDAAPRPLAVDLFAGAGGLSLGFEQAGFDVVAAVEIDPIHASIHKFNFPGCAVIPRSATELSGPEIRKAARIGNRRIAVVCGGAPCQGFSLIGQRALDDPRNMLVSEFVRIVGELQPLYFVFENVKGLTLGSHRRFLEELIDAFEAIGYRIRLPWKVLNAADHGVPQDRQRLFLLGARKGMRLPEYPEPSTVPAGRFIRNSDLPIGPTCHDALSDLPDAEEFDSLILSDTVHTEAWGHPSPFARSLRCIDHEGWYLGHPRDFDSKILSSSMRTDHTPISRRRFAETAPGSVEPVSRFFKLHPEGISNTLRAGTDSARGAFTSPRPIHYARARCITVREMARLHGFPDWFRFHATKWHGARQVGNAVPPPLARAVAVSVLNALGVRPKAPTHRIRLGDPALLIQDMSQAAAFWKVKVPIARRDRASGLRKRKQHEIEAERQSRAGKYEHA